MQAAIEIEHLSKQFDDVVALSDFSASIRAGELTGLVGPDGAGKTTLLRILAGLMKPSAGRASVAGFDVASEARSIHPLIGYMPQQFGLYEDLSVAENLTLYAELRALPNHERKSRFYHLLQFTGLEPFTARLAGKLSGGMKQKLGLACALISKPRVLLLDEPSVGVDPLSRRDLWQMVQELTDDGVAVLWSSAYLDEAENCAAVILLDAGHIRYSGPPAALSARLSGRSFLVSCKPQLRRELLTQALSRQGVCDGVIQGESVRLVLDETTASQDLQALLASQQTELVAVPPRFEDAFIDLLGGGPGGHSALAERMEPIAANRDVMVECENLSRRFGDFTATDKVSFEVRRGEIFGLLGPNGAGKSTTFKLLCGLLKPSAGTARVAGCDLRSDSGAAKMMLGYMAQKFALYGLMSVQQNLEFFSGIYGLQAQKRRQRIDEMLAIFELTPYLKVSPDVLPLGFKQRLALACALMHRPQVLFLDEPTSGVDPITRREFWTHITGLVAKGVTILVTTHFMDEAEYCDRVAMVNNGSLIALASPDELKRRAASTDLPEPTMEQAFIRLIERQGGHNTQESAA